MFDMVHHQLKKHKYKIAVGVPMVFLLASSLSLVRDPEEMCIVPTDNRYVKVGETVTLQVLADANESVNVIGATVSVPQELLTIEGISREESIIDLWSEEPIVVSSSTITFSGGIVREGGFIGQGTVLSIQVKPIQEGEATITLENTKMLAHDGTGMEVRCSNVPITLSIRPEANPNPDVNGDKRINLFDFGIVSARLFMAYDQSYDLNLDGKITIADIGVLMTTVTSGSKLGSLALLWSSQ